MVNGKAYGQSQTTIKWFFKLYLLKKARKKAKKAAEADAAKGKYGASAKKKKTSHANTVKV